MKKIKVINLPEEHYKGLVLLQNELGVELTDDGIVIEAIFRSGDLEVIKGEVNRISYQEPVHFYRGLVNLLDLEPDNILVETPQFDSLGIMIDLSRNAVLHHGGFKKVLNRMAILGFNNVLLYMEDTYEVESYPYFGYMRGRYRKEELKDIDCYANQLGIELIPCIQTLAHLKIPLKWGFGTEIKDTHDCLLVGEEKTYQFIEAMIHSISDIFTTNKIHIGMDEALQLGLGKYLEDNGFKNRFDIFMEHLNRVIEITNKYSLKPIMWSDMFLRIGSKTAYYYDTKSDIPQSVIEQIPEVELMYWDYYNPDTETYDEMIKIHQGLGKEVSFAGGIWTFNGIAPNYGRTFQTTNSALEACKKNKVKTIYATLWMDDGAETPIESSYLGLQLFAEHQFYEKPTEKHIEKQFLKFQKEKMKDFMLLDLFDQTPGVVENNRYSSAVSKLILYQDLLLGLYDKTVEPYKLDNHYNELYKQLNQVKSTTDSKEIVEFYTQLALVLSKKVTIGIRIKDAYDNKNEYEMKLIIEDIRNLSVLVDQLENAHRVCWYKMNKTIGFEVLEIRYGGIKNRLASTIYRLDDWLSDKVKELEELSYNRLIFDDFNSSYEGTLGRNFYQEIATPNILSNC